jgi:O-antigen ligase
MIKYGLSKKAGARELRSRMETFARQNPQTPAHEVYLPPFRAFENHLVVNFQGSARPVERELDRIGVALAYDNVGLKQASTVPRWRSFARNSLTYAGVCVAIFPFALYLAWAAGGRRRLLGKLGVACCLAGAGFSLSRGAWIAILIGVLYLLVDGAITWRRKAIAAGVYVAAAILLTAVYLVRYGVDPLNARALGQGSINTRATLYEDTVQSITGTHVLFGFGTEQPRSEAGSHFANRYLPRAGTHSTYLNYLFRLGFPGGIAVAAIYLIAGLHARAASRVRRGDERLFATLTATAVASVGAQALILNLFVEPIYTLSVSIVLALGMAIGMDLGASVVPWKTRRSQ